jgi:hypothetical protein
MLALRPADLLLVLEHLRERDTDNPAMLKAASTLGE